MSGDEYRSTVAALLDQIEVQRRRRLQLEAAGMSAPGVEREAERMREELAALLR